MARYLLIAVGGALGALARYALGGIVQQWAGPRMPYGTLVINVTGCLAMGVVMTLLTERGVVHPGWRFFVPIGFIGAYTTFSTFEYETFRAIEEAGWLVAAGNVVLSLVLGYVSVVVGVIGTRRLL